MRIMLLVVLGLALACSGSTDPRLPDPPLTDPAAFVVDATVTYSDVEGGCWGLRLDTGGAYQATVPDAFRRSGLRVRAGVKFRDDLVSICQMGRILSVIWMRRR